MIRTKQLGQWRSRPWLIVGAILMVAIGAFAGSGLVPSAGAAPGVVVVKASTLNGACQTVPAPFACYSGYPTGWLFYNDFTDQGDPTLGSFVTGPGAPVNGVGSAQISVSGATQRTNLATYQFAGTPLANITALRYRTYNPSAGNGGSTTNSGFLVMNVDFNNTDAWQGRLVYVPSQNGAVPQDSWKEWDALSGGAGLWSFSKGSTPIWPITGEPGTTLKSWSTILAQYPAIRIRVTDAHVGIRVGNPDPLGYTENIDSFTFGTASGVTIYDFEPETVCTTTCYVNGTTGNDAFGGDTPTSAKKTIQAGVNAVTAGGTVHVAAGTYNEDVTVTSTKNGATLQGAGIDQTIILGTKTGSSPNTLWLSGTTGVIVDGFTVTRDGNNATDWFSATTNSQGVSISSGATGNTFRNSKVTGNRNGIYIENSTGNSILNNTITYNRTGIHMVDNTSGTNVQNNFITNNWTMGVLLRDSTPPAANATSGITISNNNISGNFYSQIEARSLFSSPPLTMTNNWLGTISPTVVAAASSGEITYNSGNPLTSAPIPAAYGGPADPTGTPLTASIVWNNTASGPNASNPITFNPFLCSGIDVSPAIGFQPVIGCGDIAVTSTAAVVGNTNVTVQVLANNATNLYGVQAYLTFDSSKLTLTSVTLGTGLNPQFVALNTSTAGTISFSYSQVSAAPVAGSGLVLATLKFTATAAGAAVIGYQVSPPTLFSDNNGNPVGPATKTNGTITISPAGAGTGTVTGTILLQGRSNHSGAVAKLDPGALTSPGTNSAGAFTLSGVATGVYTTKTGIMLGYLKATSPITVAAGANPQPTVTLLGGDANSDNIINILDLSLIAAQFGSLSPIITPTTTPDINGDGVVNILDLSLAAANFAKVTQVWP